MFEVSSFFNISYCVCVCVYLCVHACMCAGAHESEKRDSDPGDPESHRWLIAAHCVCCE